MDERKPPTPMSGAEGPCLHDNAEEFNSFRSYDASVDHRNEMATRLESSRTFVSRVYARPGIGWAWTVCPTCLEERKSEEIAA